MGSATLEPSGRFQAGSWQSFTLTYTAGRFGIDDTGSIKIGFRFATDFGPVQFDDPPAPGYTTVEASNGAELEYRWEFKRNIRPWSRSLYIGVRKYFLARGDTITIRFGDRRQGSKGIRLQTYCETEFQFRVFVDAVATYDYVALPQSPKIEIAPGEPAIWRAALPTLVRAGESFRLSIKADDAWGNPSDRVDQTLRLHAGAPIEGLPETVKFKTGEFARIVDGLSVHDPTDLVIRIRNENGDELCRTNPLRIKDETDHLHFWGDLHGQSNETLGTNTAREYFLFGRDRAFLDICAHQGNDFQITGAFWRDLNELTAELDEPGRFVAIPGYEWSANTAVGGDRNVFYRNEGRPIFRSSHAQVEDMSDEGRDAHNADELFRSLKDEDCVVWAHCGGRYADIKYTHDGKLEKAVEVHSSWGTFEWLLQDALEKGYRVGIVANSDGHKGRVGASYPGASFFGSYGGLTCFLAPELSRDAIFEAMRRRHHYATTGNRLFLDVQARLPEPGELFSSDPMLGPADSESTTQLIMGDIACVAAGEVELAIEVNGSAAIERLDIFDGLDLIETVRPYGAGDLGARIRVVYQGAEYRGRARTTNWDGSLSLSGNTIARAKMFNNWNLDRGLSVHNERSASWKAVTTGNFGGFDLWLGDRQTGRISIKTHHRQADLDIADIGYEEHVLEAGGLDRALKIYRLPEQLSQRHMIHRVPVRINAEGDTRLFVRVTQIDGHRAWSSPIYLFRK
jgi:hypothetical protein